MEQDASAAEDIRSLVEQVQLQGASTSFQAVAVAAAQVLKRAIQYEEHVSRAAISLAQQEKVGQMLDELYAGITALKSALNDQGVRLLTMTEAVSVADPERAGEKETWWFALSEVIHALEKDAKWLRSLICGQQPGAPAHELGQTVIRLIGDHHDRLLKEAERWMA